MHLDKYKFKNIINFFINLLKLKFIMSYLYMPFNPNIKNFDKCKKVIINQSNYIIKKYI